MRIKKKEPKASVVVGVLVCTIMSLLDNETVKERGFVTDEYADEPNYDYVL